MASKIKIEAEHDYSFGQVLFVHPADIIANQEFNSRSSPHDGESVENMVESIKANGQIHPVLCRKDRDGRLHLIAGFRRHAAGLLIAETNDAFRLKVSVTTCNDEEAFTRNLAENVEHSKLSPIDIAVAQRRCSEEYGWDGKRIAAFFRMTQSSVSQYKKLLTLSAKIQRQVHTGELNLSAALALADLPTEQAEKIVDDTSTEPQEKPEGENKPRRKKRGGKSAAVRKAANQSKGKPVASAVSMKQLRSLLGTLKDGGENATKVATVLLDFLDGKSSESEAEGELLEIIK